MTTSKGRHVPDQVAQARARKNGGNSQRQAVTTPEQWQAALPGVLRRFKADMAQRYPEGASDAGAER